MVGKEICKAEKEAQKEVQRRAASRRKAARADDRRLTHVQGPAACQDSHGWS